MFNIITNRSNAV